MARSVALISGAGRPQEESWPIIGDCQEQYSVGSVPLADVGIVWLAAKYSAIWGLRFGIHAKQLDEWMAF